jgi:hypothetical protein
MGAAVNTVPSRTTGLTQASADRAYSSISKQKIVAVRAARRYLASRPRSKAPRAGT